MKAAVFGLFYMLNRPAWPCHAHQGEESYCQHATCSQWNASCSVTIGFRGDWRITGSR
jgi:hypothetical protein